MKFSSIRGGVCLLLSMVMFVGSPVLASEAVAIRSADYLLGQNGALEGSVLNQSGLPVSGLPVRILHEQRVIATVVSDENGQFVVQGLRNGLHTVQLGDSQQAVRFWSNTAAPPTAVSRMAIVVNENVVRGQCASDGCGEGCGEGCTGGHAGGGWKTAIGLLVIGGAVATTLALTLDDHKSKASP